MPKKNQRMCEIWYIWSIKHKIKTQMVSNAPKTCEWKPTSKTSFSSLAAPSQRHVARHPLAAASRGPPEKGRINCVWKWRMPMNCGQRSWKLRENTGMIIESLWIIYVSIDAISSRCYPIIQGRKNVNGEGILQGCEMKSSPQWRGDRLLTLQYKAWRNRQICKSRERDICANLSIRPGRNKQQKVLLYPPLRNVRLGFITMVSILEFWWILIVHVSFEFLRCVSSRFHHVQSSPSGLNLSITYQLFTASQAPGRTVARHGSRWCFAAPNTAAHSARWRP